MVELTLPSASGPIDVVLHGDAVLLQTPALALFCSRHCPGAQVDGTYRLAQVMRDLNLPVISGFHAPVERECLTTFLRGSQIVIVAAARCVRQYRLPPELRQPVMVGRAAVIGPAALRERRVSRQSAALRNQLVASLAAAVFIAFAEPDSATFELARTQLAAGKSVYTFSENKALLALGATGLDRHDCRRQLNWLAVSASTGLGPLFDI